MFLLFSQGKASAERHMIALWMNKEESEKEMKGLDALCKISKEKKPVRSWFHAVMEEEEVLSKSMNTTVQIYS